MVTKHEYISNDSVSCMITIHGNLKRTFDVHIQYLDSISDLLSQCFLKLFRNKYNFGASKLELLHNNTLKFIEDISRRKLSYFFILFTFFCNIQNNSAKVMI